MGRLIENTVEQAAIQWLEDQGYRYLPGPDIERPTKQVVLPDILRHFLQKSYPDIPQTALEETLTQFTHPEGQDLHYRNRDMHRKITMGIDISWKENEKDKAAHLYPIDFEHPENNDFLCVNQFTIEGKNQRRPDLIIFINGLPLVLFEFKNMFDENATVEDAFNQIQHYALDIPRLFEYNAITVISDGEETLHGMYASGREWFAPWKSVDGRSVAEHEFPLKALIEGLFTKDRLIAYIHNFVFHEDHSGKLIKKGAKYHQFFGIRFAVEATINAIKPVGDGRIGVIWHTQGSGKSISMAVYTGILRQLPELKNPTIVIQVDRNDLDTQLYDNFVLAKDVVGDVEHADSTDELRQLLDREAGGVIFTTIEKFRVKKDEEIDHPILSERENIIVIADEAHRTQYGFDTGGYAQNLRRALPNASFIGFTGTPVDRKDADTQVVFGETIHVYDIKQAVEDKATVPIYYEPRIVKLALKDEDINLKAEEIVSEMQEDTSNMKWAAIEDAAGADDRVAKVARDILTHYTLRDESLDGKAMIVCMSRKNCVKMYDALTQLPDCPEVAVVMTGNIGKDPESWNPHLRTKDSLEALKGRFKKPNDPLKLVIVRDMWLTGFDAPCLHTLYVDKIMHGHNLMQSIARVNRVFEDKPAGLVVDYIGIASRLRDATEKYTEGGGQGKPTFDTKEAAVYCINQLETVQPLLGNVPWDDLDAMRESEEILVAREAVNYILRDDETTDHFLKEERKLSELFVMAKTERIIWNIMDSVGFIQSVRKAVRKIKYPQGKRKATQAAIHDLIAQSIDSEKIIDVLGEMEVDHMDISILDDQFLATAKEAKDGANIRIELMRRILMDELKVKMPKNIKRYGSLKEQIEEVIEQYHKHAIDSLSVITELMKRAQELQEEDQRVKELGLSEEELAFYDILSKKEGVLREDGLMRDIVHKVAKAVKNNLQIDWYKKEDAKAAIRLAVKKELRGKVDIKALNNILAEIMEQAEGQYSDWPRVG